MEMWEVGMCGDVEVGMCGDVGGMDVWRCGRWGCVEM